MSNFGVVSTLTAPVLSSVTQPCLIQFETEYAAYKERVNDINRSRDEDQKIKPASIRNCIEPMMLHSLCIIGQVPGATSVEQATDENVKAWFENRLRCAPRDLAERVRSAVHSIKYEQCKEDPSGAALSFVLDVVKALDRNNASEVITDKERCKSLVQKLVNKLEPPELRERIKDARECWTNEEKSSLSFFQERVAAVAVDVVQGELARERLKRKRPSRHAEGIDISVVDKPTKKSKKAERFSKRGSHKVPAKNGEKKGWKYKCLNKECDEFHMLKFCKKTPDNKKKELLDAFYKDKKGAKAVVKTADAKDKEHTCTEIEDGRYHTEIENGVRAIALGDTGSDVNAIPLRLFEKVLKENPNVPVNDLSIRMHFKTAILSSVSQEIAFTASRTTNLTITLTLPGSNIPLRIRGIKFFIVDQDMDEILLGRTLLKSIGFDLNEHLARVRDIVHNKHVDDISTQEIKAASVSYKGLRYQEADDDPIEIPDIVAAGIGKDSKDSIDKAFDNIVVEAKRNGLVESGIKRLRALLEDYRDVFRIKLGPDPPARVQPLKIKLAENARPFRSTQRRYSPQQRAFIIRTIHELESVGAIYKNPSARWASPALAVPKPGSKKLRFTVDLRGPNSQTIPIPSSLPHLESRFQEVEGSICFANFDMAHGYWQLGLSPDSQEIHSIQTPIGVYSSRRLLQGGADSGNHFQAMIQAKIDGKVKRYLQWIDDFLLHAKSESELLDDTERFFAVCKEFGFKIHAEKSHLFTRRVKFCGRIFSADGMQYDPRHFSALLNMSKPTTGDQLQQLICATNWMRNSFPSYAKTIAPLHHLLEDAYRKCGKRKKQAVRKIRIDSSWGAIHDQAFDTVKQQLTAATKLSYPKPDYTTCLFTDASESHWSAIMTQVPNTERRLEIEEQNHEPLCFLSGAFTGSKANWSMPEKEGFAIVEAMCRLDYLTCGRCVSIFTDHANLIYMYDPYGRNPGMSRHTASKLMRWALKLSAFRYVVEHIPGERNVWADMLTRWAVRPSNAIKSVPSSLRLKSLMVAPINPGLDSKLDWPTMKEIAASQNRSNTEPPRNFKNIDGILKNGNVIWIPSKDAQMKIRILIAGHTGMAGHRGWRTTKATVASHFFWEKMGEDVKSFVKSCLHCLSTEPGNVIARPLGHALHASKPNELLHFDFCYMCPGIDELNYVLILKDDLSGYTWLIATSDTTAATVADALLKWFSSFGIVRTWVSDRGSHFKNQLIQLIKESIRGSHHFTLAYCPWSNGTVEVVCRELLRSTRAILSEFQIPSHNWPSVLPLVQSALNNTILHRLGNRCPLTVFTGLPQDTPLRSIIYKGEDISEVRCLEEVRAKQILQLDNVAKALDGMHKEAKELSTKKREAAVKSHNRKTSVCSINFAEGDYVLRGVLQRDRGSKPSLKWHGPFRVTACHSNYIFEVEDLLSGKREECHGRRLKFFRNADFKVTEELKNYLAFQDDEIFIIKQFDDIRKKSGKIQVLVSWKGFGDEERDWLDIEMVRENVPDFFDGFIRKLSKDGNSRQRKLAASI